MVEIDSDLSDFADSESEDESEEDFFIFVSHLQVLEKHLVED